MFKTALVVCIAGLSASCSTLQTMPDISDAPAKVAGAGGYYVNHVWQAGASIVDNVGTNYAKMAQSWDEAIDPISCKNFTYMTESKHWFVTGKLVANGVDYSNGPILDPAFAEAIGRKFGRHIGPDC